MKASTIALIATGTLAAALLLRRPKFPPFPNMIRNPDFAEGLQTWGFHNEYDYYSREVDPDGTTYLRIRPIPGYVDSAAWTRPFHDGQQASASPGDKIIFQYDMRAGPWVPNPARPNGAAAGIDFRGFQSQPDTIFYTLNGPGTAQQRWVTARIWATMPATIRPSTDIFDWTISRRPSTYIPEIGFVDWKHQWPASLIGQPFPSNADVAPWLYNWEGGLQYADFKSVYLTIIPAGANK